MPYYFGSQQLTLGHIPKPRIAEAAEAAEAAKAAKAARLAAYVNARKILQERLAADIEARKVSNARFAEAARLAADIEARRAENKAGAEATYAEYQRYKTQCRYDEVLYGNPGITDIESCFIGSANGWTGILEEAREVGHVKPHENAQKISAVVSREHTVFTSWQHRRKYGPSQRDDDNVDVNGEGIFPVKTSLKKSAKYLRSYVKSKLDVAYWSTITAVTSLKRSSGIPSF